MRMGIRSTVGWKWDGNGYKTHGNGNYDRGIGNKTSDCNLFLCIVRDVKFHMLQ